MLYTNCVGRLDVLLHARLRTRERKLRELRPDAGMKAARPYDFRHRTSWSFPRNLPYSGRPRPRTERALYRSL